MKDLYIGKVAEHLNSVQVLSTHDNKVREECQRYPFIVIIQIRIIDENKKYGFRFGSLCKSQRK